MSDEPILGAIEALRGDLSGLRSDVMGKLEQVQNELTGIREDITANMGRAERALATNENTRNELRLLSGEVASLWRQIKRLESDVRGLKGEP